MICYLYGVKGSGDYIQKRLEHGEALTGYESPLIRHDTVKVNRTKFVKVAGFISGSISVSRYVFVGCRLCVPSG